MLMTNGIGAIIGSFASGWVVQSHTVGDVTDWKTVWLLFASYALVLAVILPIVFRYEHVIPTPDEIEAGEAIEMTPH
jgi:NHS family xanthosine MFS transporter